MYFLDYNKYIVKITEPLNLLSKLQEFENWTIFNTFLINTKWAKLR